jgi:hypothetical protein
MSSRLSSGSYAEEMKDQGGGFFEASLLPDIEKEQLCRELLAEFGVTSVQVKDDGEMIHSCCLPFGMHAHGDRNPAASLNYKRLTYNCFVCGGGGLLWFIGTCRGTGATEARGWLGEQTGVGPEEQSLSSLLEFFEAVYGPKRKDVSPMPKLSPRILDPWRVIHPYMTEVRKVPEENLVRFNVGYGKLRVRARGDDFVDSERIVIPHFWKDQLVGWQSRRLVASDGTAKYLSSPDFPKDTTLYNYDPNRDAVIVESPLSVLRHAHHQHFEATFGAELTERQLRLVADHPRVILWLDNDKAGWRSTEKIGPELERFLPTYVVDSGWAADPADMDDDTVAQLVEAAIPFSLWSPPSQLDAWGEE